MKRMSDLWIKHILGTTCRGCALRPAQRRGQEQLAVCNVIQYVVYDRKTKKYTCASYVKAKAR